MIDTVRDFILYLKLCNRTGKIIPRYENENWTFTELLYEAPYLKSYQDEEDEEDEEADCLEYIDNTDKIIYL
ncbi:TPA: hypothetical protein IVO36_002998, partial [Enterococcus faecium]|nr:hypothetical protein [Enterococcus faecium]